MDDKVKILICCHKKTNTCNDNIYLPIQVGHAVSANELDMQKDDQVLGKACDNISRLNGIYCEMTAMYWAWKNIRKIYPDLKYVGLCHYRRYFYVKNKSIGNLIRFESQKIKTLIKVLSNRPCKTTIFDPIYHISDVKEKALTSSNSLLSGAIKGFDVIATEPCKLININVEDFFKVIGRDYIDLLTEIVEKNYPQFKDYYQNVLAGNRLYAANMLILKIELLDEYCSFVFGVLEKHIELSKKKGLCYDPENEKCYGRVSGYLAEILTCTYLFYCKDRFCFKTLDKCFIENV